MKRRDKVLSDDEKTMPVSKEVIGLAGEFAVASELCRRGVYAQLTLGNHKQTDLLIECDDGMLKVQVKAKQSREWPGIKGVARPDIFLVLVDYQGKSNNERPDFYVLTSADWKHLMKKCLIDTGRVASGTVTLDSNHIPTFSDGWCGMAIKQSVVTQYVERWDKITKRAGVIMPAVRKKV